jgi:hypothetical protein
MDLRKTGNVKKRILQHPPLHTKILRRHEGRTLFFLFFIKLKKIE